MGKEGARLFKKLGELRDVQVMAALLKIPDAPRGAASPALLQHLAGREIELRKAAVAALGKFNRKKWAAWALSLSARAACIPLDRDAFLNLALERWEKAFRLHRQALRNRSHVSCHRLRIGLKKFRYTLENFLPDLYQEWGASLRDLQNLLGEMHDMHVLLQTARKTGAIRNRKSEIIWRSWIEKEIHQRRNLYRQKMTGRNSLWRLWRAGLPPEKTLNRRPPVSQL